MKTLFLCRTLALLIFSLAVASAIAKPEKFPLSRFSNLAIATDANSNLTIPAPPQATSYIKGSNPKIDQVIATVENDMLKKINLVNKPQFYFPVSTPYSSIEQFYDKELPRLGWTGQKESSSEYSFGLIRYSKENSKQVALIGCVALGKSEDQGMIIWTAIINL